MATEPMSLGAYRSRQYTTATGWAEKGRDERLKQNKAMPVGPSGLPVPSLKAIFRPTCDGKLIREISQAAYTAHCRREQPESEDERVGRSLLRALQQRWPQDDMRVLARYDLAAPQEFALVDLLVRDSYERPVSVRLPELVLTPPQGWQMHADLGGSKPSTLPPVHVDVLGYFRIVARLRSERKQLFEPVGFWPSQFKARTGRWPRWCEIEREFPHVGAFLAAERVGLERKKAT